MLLNKNIEYVLNNVSNKTLELEIRFGQYDRISSNMKPKTFAKIFNLTNSGKKYTFIKETIYSKNTKKRIIYNDINGTPIKQLFDKLDPNKDILPISINDMKKTIDIVSKQTPHEQHYISKTNVQKPISKYNYKISLVNENITQTHDDDKEVSCRYKMRCSWLDAMWMFDLTIMMFHNLKTKTNKIYYEVEIEYNQNAVTKNKYTFDQILECATKNIHNIIIIIDCDNSNSKNNNVEIELMRGIHNSVSTLERTDLQKIIKSKYSVVDKADGERKYIYIDSKGNISHINPVESVIDKISIKATGKIVCKSSLIDCEFIDNKTFYGFDLLFYKNKDCRNLNLKERLKYLKIVIDELSKLKTQYNYKVKTFYLSNIFNKAGYIWNNRQKLFPYELDGLIFTPIHGTYLGHLPNLKWKAKHSIDVRIFYDKYNDFTEFYPNSMAIIRKGKQGEYVSNAYTDHKTNKIYYKNRMTIHDQKYKDIGLVNSHGVLGMSGRMDLPNMIDIVEVEFIYKEKKWVYLRKRDDKEIPNSYLSVKSVMEAIIDNITIEELSKTKYNPSKYELIGNSNANCFTNVGFNFTSPSLQYSICKFYTYCYKNIINGITGSKSKSILVLGGDICILNALFESNYNNITILENNCLEVYGETESEGYMGLNQYLHNQSIPGKNIDIVWGNDNISDGVKSYIKSGQKNISHSYDAVFINSFEVSLFNHKTGKFDESMYNKYMANLQKILKPGGSVVGIFLSGSRIMSYLEKQSCIIMRDSELNPLYKVYLKYKNIKKYKETNIFKIKEKVKMVEIQRMRNSFMSECQPVIFDSNVLTTLKSKKIKVQTCKTLKSHYADFKKNGGDKMTDYDCIISDITRYFVASF